MAKPPLACRTGTTQAVNAAEVTNWARVRTVKRTAAHRSGVCVRAIIPIVIQRRTPSGAPARPRTTTTPAPWAPTMERSAVARARDATVPISFSRFGFKAMAHRPVVPPITRASSMAVRPIPGAVSRCSSTSEPNRTGRTPASNRLTTPMAIAAPASRGVSGGP